MWYNKIMKNIMYKIKYSIILALSFVIGVSNISYSFWFNNEKEELLMWINEDGSFPKDTWYAIDEDGDEKGYNYYFDKKGGVLLDTITPDYRIVDWTGREINMDGEPVEVVVKKPIDPHFVFDSNNAKEYSEDILAEIQETALPNVDLTPGLKSSGDYLFNIINKEDPNMPRPADFINESEDLTQGKGYLLGKNVVLKEAKNRYDFDGTMKREMVDYILEGSKYSKGVKGTIFSGTKWNNCISLKGNGATITFENPKNNFNTLSGRIAMIKTTSTDRTTECELSIVDTSNEETLFQSDEFNYNSGIKFKVNFPRKTSKLRFDLIVNGQYETRTCYLKDLKFGFNKDNWIDEKYEDEIEAEYLEKYKDLIALENQFDEEEKELTDEEYDKKLLEENAVGEISKDHTYLGPDGGKISSPSNVDEDEDVDWDAIEKKLQEDMDKHNSSHGPAFAEDFVATMSYIVGPDGSRNMYSGVYEGD